MVSLNSGHIILQKAIAQLIADTSGRAAWVYYPIKKQLILANSNDEAFRTIHKTKIGLLKHRNDAGDRSLSIQELILDEEIDPANRTLDYREDKSCSLLTIYL